MIRTLFICLYLVAVLSGFCQKNIQESFPAIILRTTPTSFLEYEAGLNLGVNYRWTEKFSATFDPTFIFLRPYQNTNSTDEAVTFGIKLRADIRYHINRFLGIKNTFIAPELHLKSTGTKRWTTFGINCIGPQCDYYMYDTYKQILNEIGFSLKSGITLYFPNRNWMLEMYSGLGVKFKYFREKKIPPGASFTSPPEKDEIFGWERQGVAYPLLPGGMKLCYRLR